MVKDASRHTAEHDAAVGRWQKGGSSVFDTSVADLVFLVCAIVGGGLLLITVLLDDIIGGLFEFLDFDVGGSSLMPILLAFVAMFGIGGLFGTQVLGLSNAGAAGVGVVAGIAGGALAWGLFRFLRSSVTDEPYSQEDLVGRDAYVTVGIPRTAWGTVSMEVEGQTLEVRATASLDIERGQVVRITGVAGNGLIVEPRPAATEPMNDAIPPSSDG
jgi:membrane protein implicated in regulation of membrane protease activity